MKNTGIVRKIDDLGRVVLPIELRRTFDLKEKDRVEIYVTEDEIILRPHRISCICCGCQDEEQLQEIHGKKICQACINSALPF